VRQAHDPFVRVVKRTNIPGSKAFLFRALALIGALLAGALLVALLGYDPCRCTPTWFPGRWAKR
jgi:uncharacterized protein involved in exopolysaccharide biosynthesis